MAGEQLSPQGARAIDPVLSSVARGYHNEMAAFPYLFPVVRVGQRGGRVIAFRAEDFLAHDTRRAPGGQMARVNVGYASDPYALVQRAIEGAVPIELMEEAEAVPGIALGSRATRVAMGINDLQIEIEAARLASSSDSYPATHVETLAGNSQWSHAESKPQKAVTAAKEKIRTGVGKNPNVLVVSEAVHDALVVNPDVNDRVKYTQEATVAEIDEALLARYFGVEHYRVARCRKGEPGAFEPVWGKIAVLAFAEVSDLASMGSPSWGYTYRLAGYPVVEQAYYEERSRTWAYPTITEDTPVVAGKPAGYLFKAAVA